MKLKNVIQYLGVEKSTMAAKRIAEQEGIVWNNGIAVVFSAVVSDPERAPGNIGGNNDDEEAVIKKWILKYQSGIQGKASRRTSNRPGTVADPIIEEIIGARINKLSEDDLNKITYAHRLSMSAENILGLILEEYLADNLEDAGWYCAWGETVKSVDFVNINGRLLQVKNRSNSENSSSSAIRFGTQIEKWFRIKADRIEYMWKDLNKICGTNHLDEEGFVRFTRKILKDNPGCLAVEIENPWKDNS